ncbi:hypothetical protein KPH14_003797 [Odynerus spinipes]|uniref:Uncharacterized protein n=1 Tax=Odynerus spinipes TaxID=1348599 RepID=A0AAD9RY05_9HYME|nr:hypothetical protein KPH14_003797 [Odynerus spinipes]
MNSYDDNPFFFFVDNAHPAFPMDAYSDMGKIIELSDTGCDARTPSVSAGRRSNPNRQYIGKTHHHDVSSFRDVFDDKERSVNEQLNEVLDKRTRRVPARDRTVPRNPRSRTIERNNNEKVDQWERNIAEFKTTLLKGPTNLHDDSSIENIIDHDRVSKNSRVYDNSNLKNSPPRREINRKSRKEEMNMNVKNEMRGRVPDYVKNSTEARSTAGFHREEAGKAKRVASATRPTRVDNRKREEHVRKNDNEARSDESKNLRDAMRRSIDRAVDKDSLSDNSNTEEDLDPNANENHENLVKENNSVSVQRSKTLFTHNVETNKNNSREPKRPSSRERKTRATAQPRPIAKSADFDKAKHRANMAKRYANKTWMKAKQNTYTNEATRENENSVNSNARKSDFVKKNENPRAKAVSKSAGAPTRKREDGQTEEAESKEIDMAASFDDNADTAKRAMKNQEERSSTNKTRTTGVSNSPRQEAQNNARSSETQPANQGGIQKKDLAKLSAIFISSTLKRASKSSFSKLTNKNDRESRKEANKSDPIERKRMEELGNPKIPPSISNLSKLPSKTEKWVTSKIPVAISRLKKELEETRGSQVAREDDERIDEATSIGKISIDKSNYIRNNHNEKDEIRTRFDEWSRKLEDIRRREKDVELKVFNMAKEQKEARRKEFERRGLRESIKRPRDETKDIIDIAAKMYEREDTEKRSRYTTNFNHSRDAIERSYLDNDYANHTEPYVKPCSLRSSIYARYFPTTL